MYYLYNKRYFAGFIATWSAPLMVEFSDARLLDVYRSSVSGCNSEEIKR